MSAFLVSAAHVNALVNAGYRACVVFTPMKTKHSHSCTMAFGRYSVAGICPRCDELRNGAPARADFVARRRPSAAERDARFVAALREHRAACHCGPVCTYGDW